MSKRLTVEELIQLKSRYSENNQAEIPSEYPDLPRVVSLRCSVTKASQALGVLFYLVNQQVPPWESDVIYRSLGLQAYRCNYNGEWRTVQELLEAEQQTPEEYKQIFLKTHSPEDLYGNYLQKDKMRYFGRLIFAKNLESPDDRPVKRTIRKRGYSDKGSRRLPHEHHGDPPIRPQREDRRNRINHPLLREGFEKLKYLGEECANALTS